jgi:hypothetical protein
VAVFNHHCCRWTLVRQNGGQSDNDGPSGWDASQVLRSDAICARTRV